MEIGSFYNTAKNYAEKIKKEKPAFVSEAGSSLCMIMGDNQEIYSGISSINIVEANVSDVHSERMAIMSLITDSKGVKAKQMVIVAFSDMSIVSPCDECLDLLIRADAENGKCEIILSEDNSETALKLKSDATSVSEEFLGETKSDGDDASAKLGAPAEFVSGFEFDESNPFYEPPAEEQTEVKALNQTMGGNNNMMNGQMMGQPMMNGQMMGQPMMNGQMMGQPMMNGQMMGQPMMNGQMMGQPMMNGQMMGQPMMYGQQPMMGQPMMNQPTMMNQSVYQQNTYAEERSVHITDVIGAAHETFVPDQVVSQYSEAGDNVMQKRLANLLGTDDDDEEEQPADKGASKKDLLKASKEMKKMAKQSAKYNK